MTWRVGPLGQVFLAAPMNVGLLLRHLGPSTVSGEFTEDVTGEKQPGSGSRVIIGLAMLRFRQSRLSRAS